MANVLIMAQQWLRAFVTDGVPSSGINKPDKAEGIEVFSAIEDRLGAVEGLPLLDTVLTKTTSVTASLEESRVLYRMNNSGAATVTLPPDSSVAFGPGEGIGVSRFAAGAVTFAAGAGVTVVKPASATLALREQGSTAFAMKTGVDEWLVGGDLGLA